MKLASQTRMIPSDLNGILASLISQHSMCCFGLLLIVLPFSFLCNKLISSSVDWGVRCLFIVALLLCFGLFFLVLSLRLKWVWAYFATPTLSVIIGSLGDYPVLCFHIFPLVLYFVANIKLSQIIQKKKDSQSVWHVLQHSWISILVNYRDYMTKM